MPTFFRSLKHKSFIGLIKLLVNLAPAPSYMAFAGAGSAQQLCRHILRTGVTKILVVVEINFFSGADCSM